MQWDNALLASFPRKWYLGGRVLVPRNLSLFFLLNIRKLRTKIIYIYIYIYLFCMLEGEMECWERCKGALSFSY